MSNFSLADYLAFTLDLGGAPIAQHEMNMETLLRMEAVEFKLPTHDIDEGEEYQRRAVEVTVPLCRLIPGAKISSVTTGEINVTHPEQGKSFRIIIGWESQNPGYLMLAVRDL